MRNDDYSLVDIPSIEAEDTMSTQDATKLAAQASKATQRPFRKVLMMRHGEPLDAAFPGWTRLALLGDKYRPYDLNMPLSIPLRSLVAHADDAPLTEMGRLTAQMVGRGLRLARLEPTMIISAPELRCVQTAAALIKSLNNKNKAATICIEPGLADWRQWQETPPLWLSPRQLADLGLPVDVQYEPHWSVSSLHPAESVADYGERVATALHHVFQLTRDSGVVLIVGHGATVSSDRMSTVTELELADASVPYCSVRGWHLSDDSSTLMATLDHPIKPIHTSAFTIDS
uniref:Phosphoglycerate mutase n=1 Tax=Plectus sambesii TaxID=2011161 RepID=A0A914XIH5_9BILA